MADRPISVQIVKILSETPKAEQLIVFILHNFANAEKKKWHSCHGLLDTFLSDFKLQGHILKIVKTLSITSLFAII